MKTAAKARRPGAKAKTANEIAFYRLCRAWHAYISAFSFLALMFFSATGILLNHPDWMARDTAGPVTQTIQLVPDEVAAALKTQDPGQALGRLMGVKTALLGAYSSADIDAREALLHFEGVKGSSDVTVDLKSGKAQATIQKADIATMLDDLHRGKNTGPAWRAFIDIAGGLMLILSLAGYILLFSLRLRLRTSLILTGVSFAILIGIFVLFVP